MARQIDHILFSSIAVQGGAICAALLDSAFVPNFCRPQKTYVLIRADTHKLSGIASNATAR